MFFLKNSSRHRAFYADFGALHHIKGLSCKQTNSLERHVSVWGFCRMRVFFFLTFAERTKKLQLQFGGCLDCQFWQCLNVKQFSYVCVNNTWTCCSKPSRRDVSSVQSPIDIQLFWLGRDSYHNVRHEILPQIKLASCSSRFFTAKNMQIFRVNGCFLAKIQASRAVTGWCLLVPRKGADSLSQFWGHEFMNSCR